MPGKGALQPARGWRAALAVYNDRRQLFILLMGFASGLPLLLTSSTLAYWLKSLGQDNTSIGLFVLVGVPYGFKFLWAPVLDHVRVPWLSARLGRRRAWALVIQAALVVAILVLGATDPLIQPWATAAVALTIAFLSASQDIVIDAYRIEVLERHEQGAGAGTTQIGYRVGLLVASAGAIALCDFVPWSGVFAALAGLIVLSMVVVLLAPRPSAESALEARNVDAAAWLKEAVVAPFVDFLKRPAWLAILAFVLLYKFGDAIGGVMANPFYVELGFSGVEIASVTKVFGMLATIAGGIAGGLLVARFGIFPALLAGGVLQAVTNLLFAAQAAIGHDIAFLALAIGVDNFSGGLGSAAFVAYLSSLCNVAFTGTQYALLTSFMAFGRTVLSSGGGWLADQMDWVLFFVLTTGLAVPGLLLLFWLMRQPRLAAREASQWP